MFKIPGFFVVIIFLLVSACNSTPDPIPFPEKEFGYSQPQTTPLQISETRQLRWDTISRGQLKPAKRNLDLSKLPYYGYDSSGFKPFDSSLKEFQLNLAHLPDTTFDLETIPSTPLVFKSFLVIPPTPERNPPPTLQKDRPLSLYDLPLPRPQNSPGIFQTALLKDRNGLLWIGGIDGIYRYDGENLQTLLSLNQDKIPFAMTQDSLGRIWIIDRQNLSIYDPNTKILSLCPAIVAGTDIVKLFVDKKGRIWVLRSALKSVILIDPHSMSFKSIGKAQGLADSSVADILQLKNGNLWLTTNTKGIAIIDEESKKIKFLNAEAGLPIRKYHAITMDDAGTIWLASDSINIEAINTDRSRRIHYDFFTSRDFYLTKMFADNLGRIWLGTDSGLHVFDFNYKIRRWITEKDGLSDKLVTGLVRDNNNRMWVLALKGLHYIDQNAETTLPIPREQVTCTMEDSAGIIWAGTRTGILLIDPITKHIRKFDESNGLGNNFVQSISKNGREIWITTNGGFDIIDPVQKTLEHIGKKQGMSNDSIYVVHKTRDANIWLSGPSNGVYRIDIDQKNLYNTRKDLGISDNNIGDIKQDDDGKIWLATRYKGVDVVDPVRGVLQNIRSVPGLADTCNRVIVKDKRGKIWIGTDKGIYVIDKKENTVTTLTTKEGLFDNKILSLLEHKGNVLATADKMVSIIIPPWVSGDSTNKWQISLLDKSENLARQSRNAWLTDAVTANGTLIWGDIGLKMIYRLSPYSAKNPTFISGINILTRPNFFANKISLGPRDTLMTPDSMYTGGQKPIIKEFASAEILKYDGVDGPFSMPVNLKIPYNQNAVQFYFTMTHLGSEVPTKYVYVLEGADKTWSLPSTKSSTENYLNLSPGKYTFRVAGMGVDRVWSEPAVFSFTVLPPWYQTWWAYTIFVFVGLGALRAYILYRSRQLKQENKILEEKVQTRTRQLQESIEELKTTQSQLIQSEKMASLGELTAGIAHEIQNPLNFINNFSEVNKELLAEMQSELDKNNMLGARDIAQDIIDNEEKIVYHGKRADAIVKGMLQHSRSSSGVKELVDINALCDEYLRLSYHGLRAKDKSFNAFMTTKLDESIGKVNIVPQDIGRVILNLINNAFYAVTEKKKSMSADYQPTVTVSTKRLNGKVELKVSDNGNGIPKKDLEKIFQPFFTTKPTGVGTGLGLSLSYDVIKKGHGGDIRVETQEGMGTTFIITLPNS